MKETIKKKMDEHVDHILQKPSITNEDYALLEAKLNSIKENGDTSFAPMLMLCLFMLMNGGKHHEL